MTNSLRILIVDDDPLEVDLLEQEMEELGYETASTPNGLQALKKIIAEGSNHGFPGILVTDIRMPQMDGLELMKRTLELDPDLPIVLVTAYGDIAMAVQAMHDGAYDFIEKPVKPERLRDVVKRAIEKRSLILENRALRAKLAAKPGMDARIIGSSPQIVELRENIAKLCDTNASVLIFGETGTGKELVARCLHEFSRRRKNHFVPVNCGAIPENIFESELFGHEAGAFTGANQRRIGRLEHAHNGTVFFDEIESMPLHLQVKLLRVLEERVVERLGSNKQISVDFRIIAAAKTDLQKAMEQGDFREDLYFRINITEVHIPPLRDRREDIPILFEFFADQLAARHEREVSRLSRENLHKLMAYSWPGNVRELKNIAERYVLGIKSQNRSVSLLIHPPVTQHFNLADQIEAFEKSLIEQSLLENKGNIQATMEDLGTPRRTLNDKMRKHGLDRKKHL